MSSPFTCTDILRYLDTHQRSPGDDKSRVTNATKLNNYNVRIHLTERQDTKRERHREKAWMERNIKQGSLAEVQKSRRSGAAKVTHLAVSLQTVTLSSVTSSFRTTVSANAASAAANVVVAVMVKSAITNSDLSPLTTHPLPSAFLFVVIARLNTCSGLRERGGEWDRETLFGHPYVPSPLIH